MSTTSGAAYFIQRHEQLNYQPHWQSRDARTDRWHSRLGLEFNQHQLREVLPHLPLFCQLGCNQLQFQLEEMNLASNHTRSLLDELTQALKPHPGVNLSLHLKTDFSEASLAGISALGQSSTANLALKLMLEPQNSHFSPAQLNKLSDQLHSHQQSCGLVWRHQFEFDSLEQAIQLRPDRWEVQVPFNVQDFRAFLARQLPQANQRVSLAQKLRAANTPVSFRSPFFSSAEVHQQLVAPYGKPEQDLELETQAALINLRQLEGLLNQDITAWMADSSAPTAAAPFQPFELANSLMEKMNSIQSAQSWKRFCNEQCLPSLREKIRYWNQHLPQSCKEPWRWHIETLMDALAAVTSLQTEILYARQRQRLRPIFNVLDRHLPGDAAGLSYAAKTLWLLASTPWPDCVFFPFDDADQTAECLGLMRRKPLENAGTLLKMISDLPQE